MPFVSDAQRAWMYANKPAMAKEWQSHTPKGADLPEHVKDGKRKAAMERALSKRGA
jgi:hypothetical protein